MKSDAEFMQQLFQEIPLVQAMQLQSLQFDGQFLELKVPLAPNLNDKGTAFGGSLAALATLAGWCLTTRYLHKQGWEAEVVVVKSEIQYLAPVTRAFTAQAKLPNEALVQAFTQSFSERGRARWTLEVLVEEAGQRAFVLTGEYLARVRPRLEAA
ncbi:YiiD C-terminal domain-containing protein [Nitrincola tapanii]|nr:YiiD C-terminal domain-containing protein [Nitrincola tapanii]